MYDDYFAGVFSNAPHLVVKLEAWLTFLSADEPEMIRKLILSYPQFEKYHEEIYELCGNTEKVMDMFSKELYELDKNTVQYMMMSSKNCSPRGGKKSGN